MLLLLLACSSSPPAAEAPATPPAPAAPAPSLADAANAKLPAGAAVRFEERDLDDRVDHFTARAVVPVGWTESHGFTTWLKPPDEAKLGFMTSFHLASECGGACEAKDWKAVVDGQMLANVVDKGLIGDEPLPNGRIRWGADDTSARIFAAWWQEGQPRFHTCTVILDSPTLLPMIDAFVEACKTSKLQPA